MFFCHLGNKLDGPGSMYSYDASTGKEEAKHALFTSGLKGKELSTPFVPKVIDLPENHLADKLAAMGLLADEDSMKSSKRTKIDEMFHAKSDAHDWKKKLGKYLRLKASEAREFNLISKADNNSGRGEDNDNNSRVDHGSESDDDEDGEEGDGKWASAGQDAATDDDVAGYHFVDIPGLFVAYAYVTAAAKVLESREATRQLHKMPDFEEVYHLVIDAVDTYNEAWENEFRKTHLSKEEPNTAATKTGDSHSHPHLTSPSAAGRGNGNGGSSLDGSVQNKKHVYMSAVSTR